MTTVVPTSISNVEDEMVPVNLHSPTFLLSSREDNSQMSDHRTDSESSQLSRTDEKKPDEPVAAIRAEAEVQRMLSTALSNNQRRLERAYMQIGRKENASGNPVTCWSNDDCKEEPSQFDSHDRNVDVEQSSTTPNLSSGSDFPTISDRQNNLKCSKCHYFGTNAEDLIAHCTKQHEPFQLSVYHKQESEVGAPNNKPDFNEPDFESKEARQESQEINCENTSRVNKAKMHRCKQCKFFAFTKEEFWAHARTHMKEEKILECPSCSFVTEYKHHLEYHIRNHIGSKPFKCDKCSYECVNKSMLNSHMKSHNNVYQYLCADCCYATKYCHSMKLHINKYRHRPATILHHTDLGQVTNHISQSCDDRSSILGIPQSHTSGILPPTSSFNAAAVAAVAAAAIRDEASHTDSTSCRNMGIHGPSSISTPVGIGSQPSIPMIPPTTPGASSGGLSNFHCGSSTNVSTAGGASPLWPPSFPSLLTAFTGSPYFSSAPHQSLIPPPMGSPILPPHASPAHQHGPLLKSPFCLTDSMALGGTSSMAPSMPSRGFLMPLMSGAENQRDHPGSVSPPKRPLDEVSHKETDDEDARDKDLNSERESPFDSKRPKLERGGDEASPGPETDFPDDEGRVVSVVDPKMANGVEIDGYMECSHCELLFRDHIMFDIHMGYHGYTNPFACNRCGYIAATKVEFFLHLMQKSH